MREAILTLSNSELETIGFDGLVSLFREAGIRDVEMLEDYGYTVSPRSSARIVSESGGSGGDTEHYLRASYSISACGLV